MPNSENTQLSSEEVTLEVIIYAVPQLIAPQGRWYFKLIGRMFEVTASGYMPAHSAKAAERDGRKLAAHLGLIVGAVNVEKINVLA
jgi:hypothetical protein